ncbi:glycosyltransferase family 9 protein [Bernardetia sp.]|uniref:glycosyltransferase family 9 protein n=1 Tax=Bernardetia sp. TaxID=1937974 RepID=UPI0025BC40C6|nr:glycosyltransferase family 9 protein [Bernardetia sp.]
MKKILILRFSSIGDIVLTTPVIRSLKMQFETVHNEELELHYATKASFESVLKYNPYLDKIHLLQKEQSISDFIAILKKEKFDFIIDLHKNLRTSLIKFRISAKSYSFDKLNFEKWLYVNLKKNKMPNRHIVERYMDTLKPLGITLEEDERQSETENKKNKEKNKEVTGLDYFLGAEDHFEIEWLPKSYQNGYIAFAIGGAHNTKKLPLKRMIELCDKINKPIVLLGGKEDMENGKAIFDFFEKDRDTVASQEAIEKLGKKTRIFDGCGKLTLGQSASLLKQSKVVFTHDTGLMHIAAAFKKKIYSIWGNTTPALGMYPYKTEFVIFENNKISCRPCSKIGFKECPKGHFKCMNELIFDFWIP